MKGNVLISDQRIYQKMENNLERIDLALEEVGTVIEEMTTFANEVLKPLLTKKDMKEFNSIVSELCHNTDEIEERLVLIEKLFN